MVNSSETDGNDKDINYDIGSRLDNLGRIPIKKSIIVAISLSSFFALYDVSNFQYISPVLKSAWHLTDSQIAYSISMRILGQVVGAFCISTYADWCEKTCTYDYSYNFSNRLDLGSSIDKHISSIYI